jgi:glycosyltransferase involved in cell wall biosynthesis
MQNKTISFLTYDWAWGTKPLQPNGCAWYRCLLPMKELEKFGWKVSMGFPRWHEEYGYGQIIKEDQAVHGWNILVFKLIMRKSIAEHVRKAQALGQTIVVDVDDFFEGLDENNRAYTSTDPLRDSENNRDHYIKMIYEADAVITSTPFLYEYYSKRRNNVFMVRNGIDISRWTRRKDIAKHKPVVGWVGATPWRSGDLEILRPYIHQHFTKHNLKFHHSGHTPNAPFAFEQIGIPKSRCTIMPMAPILDYPKLFPPIDIGIVPLNDLPFNHAKSFIKGLEYAAAGVPFIASNSPEYKYLADLGVGRVASNREEWLYHLEELLNPQMRKDEAVINYEIIKDKFSMEVRGSDWNDVMERIAKL